MIDVAAPVCPPKQVHANATSRLDDRTHEGQPGYPFRSIFSLLPSQKSSPCLTQSQPPLSLPATNTPPAPTNVNTARANRAAALATYFNACSNVGAVPDPNMLEEHGHLTAYAEIDPADDHLVLEAQVEPGTLGWTRHDGREPATGTLIANGMLSVSLTFRGDGLPTVVIENLHDGKLLVAVEDGNDHRLYHGLVEQS